jgi:hypothetical protein
VDILLNDNDITDKTMFYDLCCGSGAISIELVNRGIKPEQIVMLDASPWGLFWKMIGDGTFDLTVFKQVCDRIPKDITKIKNHMLSLLKQPADIETVYTFLVLQAASFGGTPTWIENNEWKKNGGLRNYWMPTETSSRRSPVNPMMPMPDTLLDRVERLVNGMRGCHGLNINITSLRIFEDDAVIYIDPPYSNTTGYGHNFDVIKYVNQIGRKCYVSEGKN